MNADFSRALARAMERVRAQDPAGATTILQAALAGSASPTAGTSPTQTPPAQTVTRITEPEIPEPAGRFHPAPDVEDAEIVRTPPNLAPPDPASEDAPVNSPAPGKRRSLGEVVDLLRAGRPGLDLPSLNLPGLDLSSLDLSSLDLPGLDLSGLDLPGIDLPGARPPAPPLPEGARFEWRSHASGHGTRRYRLFVPSCPASALEGLVVMLHGCTQGPDDFAAGTDMNRLAEKARLLVAYPEQPKGANASGCWNWFDPAHQRRDAGEPAILAELARDLAAEFALPADRIFAAGLSAGGAMAAVLAETYGDVFAAVGIHSGLPRGAAHDVASAFAAMRGQGSVTGKAAEGRHLSPIRAIVFHGTADRTVSPANARALAARFGGTACETGGETETGTTAGRTWHRSRVDGSGGTLELWLVDGAGHAWSGGHSSGSYTDPKGPDASAEMLRFFLEG